MNRPAFFLATVFTLLLTGLVLGRTGWFRARLDRADVHGHVKAHDSLTSDAAWRWRHGQATHWRACLLQR